MVLAIIDQHWKEHLRDMDDLRSNVQHARFEQKDPLLIYKFESYELFQKMVQKVNAQVASFLMKCTIPTGASAQQPRQAPRPSAAPRVQEQKAGVAEHGGARFRSPRRKPRKVACRDLAPSPQVACLSNVRPRPQPVQPIRTEKKVLPNDPCPCGSGKKYKKCHG